MAKNVKKISINAIDDVLKNIENTEIVEWCGIDVEITKTLSLESMLSFADSVVKSCFDSENGAYLPEIKDFAIRSNVLDHYANFKMPGNIEKQYAMVMQSGAFDMIIQHINTAQFFELVNAIDKKIDHIASANIQKVYSQMDEVVSAFEGMQEKFSSLFSGVNPDDLTKLVSAIGDGGIDESKIVEARIRRQVNL